MKKLKQLFSALLISVLMSGGFAFASVGGGGVESPMWKHDGIGNIEPVIASWGVKLPVGGFSEGDFSLTANDLLEVDSIFGSTSILPVRIGDGATTTHSLNTEDDLLVTGELEVDGTSFFDAVITLKSGNQIYTDASNLAIYPELGTQTPASGALLTGTDSNNILIAEYADRTTDFGHALQTNPTIWLHSADATDLNDYILLQHDQSKAVITTARGNIQLNSPDGLNILDSNVQALSIQNDGTKSTLIPASGDYTRFGDAGTTTHSLASEDDLMVTGKLEVDGVTYLDAQLNLSGNFSQVAGWAMTSATDVGHIQLNNSQQTTDSLSIAPRNANNIVLMCETEDENFDFAHSAQTNPTIFTHSANQSTTEWLSLSHDQTDGRIQTGAGNLSIGSGSDSHALTTPNDLYVSGKLEVDGISYHDGLTQISTDIDLGFGSSSEARMRFGSAQTPDSLVLGLPILSNGLILSEVPDRAFDFAHALQTNPTLFIHSANQATDEWISLTHNQTNGIIDVGTGTLILDAPVQLISTTTLANSATLQIGVTNGMQVIHNTAISPPQTAFGVGAGSNAMLITEATDRNFDFAHGLQTNPTLFGHSANQVTDEWWGLTHDQTNTVLDSGTGGIVENVHTIKAPSTTQVLVAGTPLTVSKGIMRIDSGAVGAVIMTATPTIVDGTDGTCVIVQGDDDTNTIKFQDESNLANSGLQLSGGNDFTFGAGDILEVCYDLGDDNWYEISRSDN